MDICEQDKKGLAGNEAMESDVVAQATVDGIAQKLFNLADKTDRAGGSDKYAVRR